MNLKIGQKAPSFKLPDQDGVLRQLKDYAGQWLLIYFYPKDDTPGCTTEACSLRDNFPKFKKITSPNPSLERRGKREGAASSSGSSPFKGEVGRSVTILGVSIDNVKSHNKFVTKYKLPFTLLADENKEMVEKYGVWAEKSMYGRKYMGTLRTSFLIDPTGKIAKIYEKVKPAEHAEEVLVDIAKLNE